MPGLLTYSMHSARMIAAECALRWARGQEACEREDPCTPTISATPIPPFAGYAVAIPYDGAYMGLFIGDLPSDYEDQLSMIESFEYMIGRRLAIVNVLSSMTTDGGNCIDFHWLNLHEHFADGRIVMFYWHFVDWDSSSASESPIQYQRIIDGEQDQIIRAAARDVAKFGQPGCLRWAWESTPVLLSESYE